jgi:hypothetical protein
LPTRLTQGFHGHHDLSQATLHVHFDAESCREVIVPKGRRCHDCTFQMLASSEFVKSVDKRRRKRGACFPGRGNPPLVEARAEGQGKMA